MVVAGGPELGLGTLREQVQPFRQRHDNFGTRFLGTAHVRGGMLTPTLRRQAYVTNEGELIAELADPLLPLP